MDIYKTLNLPPLSPPSYIFPIVWVILYILMGISSYIVYKSHSIEKKFALTLYGLQLLFNFIWTLLFFNGKMYFSSFLWLIMLWILILGMFKSFKLVDKTAGYLQLPYLLWVTFAGYLNLMVSILN